MVIVDYQISAQKANMKKNRPPKNPTSKITYHHVVWHFWQAVPIGKINPICTRQNNERKQTLHAYFERKNGKQHRRKLARTVIFNYIFACIKMCRRRSNAATHRQLWRWWLKQLAPEWPVSVVRRMAALASHSTENNPIFKHDLMIVIKINYWYLVGGAAPASKSKMNSLVQCETFQSGCNSRESSEVQ